ncbi:MAG: flavodoxin family protein [Armatimonadetes bacterium CG_4_10_14_3_um_filter_66_18]|nr:flavodoxin family protein [Armatimonadota bacterium]OIP05396.1 MAG: NADPH-dependent FMN reductase [Armatimonadetes bacterium CG2_30_66_41]PIU95061.1 MAG: flavodoxin family protein [Armatimonadetes bacterium CG06_land_8_20_14_3_00_66_21]PIW18189.1 MAG: flavodoxin family protein [Armatimonadetes bacterium CG17_big_fil_post_rev_8_21_14_2_50_66_6]PIX37427.1 MAG: flavodoxin family protein [Armatimonadetes bacterium CG_4_8_14_3_um_filter_66_20]PIY43081.1 MAG: flavodoxin family protein [Armatimona
MKVLGISGSPRNESTAQLVQAVLAATGLETEFVSLAGRNIGPCVACVGCVKDNVCVVKDDMAELRGKLVEADAFVVGGANYYSHLNGLTHSFLERWYQFRHQEGGAVVGKLAVAVGVGGMSGDVVADSIETFMSYNLVETVAKVWGQGAACCFTCGHGEECKVGAIHMFFGPGTKITEDIFPRLSKQPEVLEQARLAGHLLGERLRNGHDRQKVAQGVMAKLGARFKEAG